MTWRAALVFGLLGWTACRGGNKATPDPTPNVSSSSIPATQEAFLATLLPVPSDGLRIRYDVKGPGLLWTTRCYRRDRRISSRSVVHDD